MGNKKTFQNTLRKSLNREMSSVLSNGQLTVPDGLPAALESLARAVLKEQPTDLANFAATHFRVLLSQRSATGKDPFTDSTFFNNETVPPKFTDPLPDSQRQTEEDMGSGASKASSKASTPRKESPSEAEPVSAVVEPTSEPVSEPISEPEPPSEPVSEPISAPTEAAEEPTAGEVSQAQEDTTQIETEKSEVTEASEAIDIDLNDPGVEEAAVKIQAAFRGHQVRKDASADSGEAAESEPVTEEVVDQASEEAPAEPSAPVEESVPDEPASEPLTETEVATTEEAAAETPAEDAPVEEAAPVESTETTEEPADEAATEVATDEASAEPATEEIDIDLNDPKTEEAAIKIQSAFRGHQVRQEMTNGETEEVAATEETTETKNEAEEVIDIDLNDPQTEEAAVKIQAAFRGHQTRTEMAASQEVEKTEETTEVKTEDKTEEEAKPEAAAKPEEKPEETAEERAESRAEELVDDVVERVTTPAPVQAEEVKTEEIKTEEAKPETEEPAAEQPAAEQEA